MNLDYSMLPEHMRDGMQRYVEHGAHPGSFLYLVLCNNFVDALGAADYINADCLADYARFLFSKLPIGCWGSKAKVDAWIEKHAKGRLLTSGKPKEEEESEHEGGRR